MNHLGLSLINRYAEKFLWRKSIPADFETFPSYFEKLIPHQATVASVGKFAAGFGMVGLSPMHAAWMTQVLGNGGVSKKLRILAENQDEDQEEYKRVINQKTSLQLLKMMQYTVLRGTASSIFSSTSYRRLRRVVGGKTGTLYAKDPNGLSTWFAGLMPIQKPEVAVVALVVNKSKWVIKGSHLAAEALLLWSKYKKSQVKRLAVKSKRQ